MEKYIKSIVECMYKFYNYSIVEFQDDCCLISKWGLCKIEGENLEVVIFSTQNNFRNINFNSIYFNLKEKYNFNKIKCVVVMLEEPNIYPQCGLILIDSSSKNIVYSTQVPEDTLNRIYNCVNAISQYEQNKNKEKFQFSIKDSSVTYTLIALNIIVYIISSVISHNFFTIDTNVLVFMGAKVNSLISKGEYYRLVSCMFLHAGIMHIVFNMYALYIMGPIVEKFYGKVKYLFIYFFSGIMSSILSYVLSPYVSIGASGAIFGLLGAAFVFGIKMRKRINKEYIYSIVSVIVANLVLGFSVANIDNFGHIGGLIGGVLCSSVIGLKNKNSQ
ncbi:rhomboid family intramembrane serine protease [Clostridium sp. cel8]|jgi:rhomboid protease GluP|uniref:rhomboid family intramembrane serine protease n=1 Tax=unclassified Clostridium TaxID=2614128 RepID=UPI0015F69E13|nr:rhomboid family intramembrane serine protease [Clostridium sp. cel8]MBA5851283.1 rhomboid family intramembrane serine protease [Clostridium sp. cel8]